MTGKVLYIPKITRPVLKEVLYRQRLFELLEGKLQKPLLWVSGPAGSGKTALLSSYIDYKNIPHIWYNCSPYDSDIATFVSYMTKAVKTAYPRNKKTLPLYTQEYQAGGLEVFCRVYFEELFRIIKEPFVIVFDNYQELQGNSEFNILLTEAVECCPEGINITVLSREELADDFTALRLQGKVSTITWKDLLVSEEEAKAIITKRQPLPDEIIKEIHDMTRGWLAGVVLVAETIAADESLKKENFQRQHLDVIFSYLASEVLDKTDRATREFLLKTSLLSAMTVKMAEALTGITNAREVLTDLYRRNLFIYRHASEIESYEYHPLFRKFLQTFAERTFSREQLHSIQTRAAELLEGTRRPEEAAELYIKTSNWQKLSELILKNAENLLKEGRNLALEGYLKSIPDNILKQNPYLIFYQGLCKLPYNPPESLECFEKTYRMFKAQSDIKGMLLSICSIVDAILYIQADFHLLDRWIRVLRQIFKSHTEFPSLELRCRAVASMHSALIIRRPYPPEITVWLRNTLNISRNIEDPDIRIPAEVDVSFYYQWTGQFAKAEEILEALRKIVRQGKISPLTYTTFKAFDAMYYLLKGMHERCISSAEEGIRMAKETGSTTMLFQLLTHCAAGYIGKGQLDRAEELLHEASLCVINSQVMNVAYYHYLMAWLNILKKDTISAGEHITIALSLVLRLGFPFLEAVIRLAAAQIFFETGHTAEASKNLEAALKTGRRMKSYLLEYSGLMILAYFKFKENNTKEGYRALKKALKIGKEHGIVYFLFWRPRVISELATRAIESGIEMDYVCELIKQRNISPDRRALTISNWPWPVRIYTLGRFTIETKGKVFSPSGRTYQKPLSLLKAIISSGGKGVSILTLIDLLWPETTGDAAFSAFSTNLQRLRNILSTKEAIVVSEGKVSLNPSCCYLDIWALEEAITYLEQRISESPMEDLLKLIDTIMETYRGCFLPEDTEIYWTVVMREKLRSRFLRFIITTGELLQKNKLFKKAVELYQRGIETEPFAEEIYQQLMICYAHLGYAGEVEKTYRKCVYMLSTTLGVPPSEKTIEIYKRFCQ